MTDRFRPMLAEDAPTDLTQLSYPALVSVKLDGVRAIVRGGVLYSRNMKPIVNKLLQARYGRKMYEGLDGELIDGPPTATDVFSRTQSVTKREDKAVSGTFFYVFDNAGVDPMTEYQDRYKSLQPLLGDAHVIVVEHELAINASHLEELEGNAVAQGWEGLMVRSLYGRYKYGRSTLKEGWLLKVKRFEHDEAMVLDVYEQEANGNEQVNNELGLSKRSSKKAGKTGKGTLGGFRVRMMTGRFKGVELNVGTGNGWTAEKRAGWWKQWQEFKDLDPAAYWLDLFGYLRVKHQSVGSKDAPRFPIGDGWREPGQ